MRRPTSSLRGPLALVAVAILAGVVAIPALAASPSPSGRADNGNHGGPKDSHEPEVTVTLTGTVAAVADKDGSPDYALTTGGKTLRLSDGPPWFWGAKNPLGAYVGQSVTIVGEQSGDEVDVSSVNGTALRAPGKPPWAGGPGVVGQSHPGWSQSKADRSAAKQAARDARDKAKAACRAAGTCADDEPEASEAP